MTSVESELTSLPDPVPPTTLAATVMARVSRLPEGRPRAARSTSGRSRISREDRIGRWTGLAAAAAALTGVAIVVVSWLAGRLEAGSWLARISPRVGTPLAGWVPPGGFAVPGIALGLLLYVGGLFAPLRNRPSPRAHPRRPSVS
jgi:hypothetical protein